MTRDDLKEITEARMKSAMVLMGAKDWFWAGFTMALALEAALKAIICKTLNLPVYPQDHKQQKIVNFFLTHEFTPLLVLSGLSNLFSADGIPEVFQNWSDFTKEFPGNWADLKYENERQRQFDQGKAERLLKNLTDSRSGVLTKLKEKW